MRKQKKAATKQKPRCLTCERRSVQRGLCQKCRDAAQRLLSSYTDAEERKRVEEQLIASKLILPARVCSRSSLWRTKALAAISGR